VLTFGPATRIYAAVGPTDMRKQFDGLVAAARDVLKADPFSGHVFAFCNRRRDRIKLLVFDRSGFWLLAKRLEGGTFAWPSSKEGAAKVEWRPSDLALLLSGVDPAKAARRRWWTREVAAVVEKTS
jgi:transposase